MLQKFKIWISGSLPEFPRDKRNHFTISWIFASLVMVGGVLFNPFVGLTILLVFFLLQIATEIVDLKTKNWTPEAEHDSVQDLMFGAAGQFFQTLVLLILSTK